MEMTHGRAQEFGMTTSATITNKRDLVVVVVRLFWMMLLHNRTGDPRTSSSPPFIMLSDVFPMKKIEW